jgi:hypothetical protein
VKLPFYLSITTWKSMRSMKELFYALLLASWNTNTQRNWHVNLTLCRYFKIFITNTQASVQIYWIMSCTLNDCVIYHCVRMSIITLRNIWLNVQSKENVQFVPEVVTSYYEQKRKPRKQISISEKSNVIKERSPWLYELFTDLWFAKGFHVLLTVQPVIHLYNPNW